MSIPATDGTVRGSGESADRPRDSLLRTIIQGATLTTMLGVLAALIKLVWIAGATYTAFTDGLEAEKMARVADVAAMRHEAAEAEIRLGVKIDNNARLETQQITTLSDKVTDLKTTLADIVKASTPTRR